MIGALIIAYTILVVPEYNYSMVYPKTLSILIIQAPTVGIGDGGFRASAPRPQSKIKIPASMCRRDVHLPSFIFIG